MAEGVGGFWSYVHADNEDEDGRILRLADRLRAEFAVLTAASLELFVDREGINWGDEWRRRIDEALEVTTFFIPIVTPRYFRSPECRKELLTFGGHAQSLGLDELLLPIYWVEVPGLNEESDDEAKALVARMQRADWRGLRLADEQSAEYRQAVNKLAQRLAEIADRTEAEPVETKAADADEEGEEEPGFIELLAEGERALPGWAETLTNLGNEIEGIGTLAQEATVERAGER